MKVLLAERDQNERAGIEWLMKTYSLPVNEVAGAGSLKETLSLLEREVPDILLLELDMIPAESWPQVLRYSKSFCKKVIAVTVEATFAKARQAIELQCVDLLVKPLEPAKVKVAMQKAISLIVQNPAEAGSPLLVEQGFTYRSLFLEEEMVGDSTGVILLQTEDQRKIQELVSFLQHHSFLEVSSIFPLSNLVVCVLETPSGALEEEARKLIRDWESGHAEPLAAVVLPRDTGKASLHDMYQTGRRLLEVTFFIGYHQVITEDAHDGSWRAFDPFLTPKQQREWIDMLNHFDREKIKRWLHEEFLHMEPPFPNPEMLRTRLTSILAQARRFMKTYQLDGPGLEELYMNVFSDILYHPVLYRIVQNFLLFLYELVERASQAEALSKKDVIERGIQYIEEHYADPDLTLQKVTQAIGMSYAYYSHLLMKKLSMTFRQLLTEVRVKEAKVLLAKSQLSIKEIASEVGFRNANYFARNFKKLTGLSPREYRAKLGKED
ncbi:helix-turn-helix domain-containing protein [Neobacillus notoginsengisoli]|uniref:Helix-turn-helix domain-containing protein n=1 Tax=Neobacillus notoginsengisoli TaxID=1578198 RepID=A0A417YYC5_9BACI|nr:helix-turn-helix domain-containing protein [Neobacillus notoginsengisoli]RHW42759.1 helix-turn-helix domain-containing protein [Neobacillus notoginsengisoli]